MKNFRIGMSSSTPSPPPKARPSFCVVDQHLYNESSYFEEMPCFAEIEKENSAKQQIKSILVRQGGTQCLQLEEKVDLVNFSRFSYLQSDKRVRNFFASENQQ